MLTGVNRPYNKCGTGEFWESDIDRVKKSGPHPPSESAKGETDQL